MTSYGSDRNCLLQNSYVTIGDTSPSKRLYFGHLETTHLAAFHLLVSLAIFVTGVKLELNGTGDHSCRTYFILLYIRCAYWALTYFLDLMITRRHRQIRRYGYHEFYRQNILNYTNAPFNIVSLWNTIIFLIQTLMQQKYGVEFPLHCQRSIRSPITYVCMFCGLETILLIFVHGTYIIKVWQFNRTTRLPDALRDTDRPFIGSLGITTDDARVAELLEKQADLIYYLKELNYHLNKKLIQLSNQIKLNK